MYNAIELRDSLSAILNPAAAAYADAKRAFAELGAFVSMRDPLPWEASLVESCVSKWLEGVLAQVSAKHQGDSSAVISLDDVPNYFRDVREFAKDTYYELRDDKIALDNAVEAMLAQYSFDNLVQWLAARAKQLEASGLVDAANYLANELSLNADHWNARAPIMKSGRFVFEPHLFACQYSGYSYQQVEKYLRLADAMGVMQRVMGVTGAHASMHSIASELRNARKPLPSRTVIGHGAAIAGTVFKEKIALAVIPAIADALLAFVSMYATVKLVGTDSQKAA